MELTTAINNSSATIAVSGTLTVASAPSLEAAFAELPEEVIDVTLDFSELDYVASAGLRVIVSQNKKAFQKGGSLHIAHPNDEVMEVFDDTGLVDVLDIVQ